MTLNIFGMSISVLKDKNLSTNYGLRGVFYPVEKKIVIDNNMSGPDFLQTLVHELIHVVIFRVGIDQTKISEDLEEVLCESISTAVLENWKSLASVYNKK